MAEANESPNKPKVIFGHKIVTDNGQSRNTRRNIKDTERVMYPRHLRGSSDLRIVNGRPITADEAVEVRQLVFGTSNLLPRGEWLRAGMVMRDQNTPLAYGIKSQRNTTRGLLTVVQAHIIRQLLFQEMKGGRREEHPMRLLMPNEQRQTEALWMALADILWNIGEKRLVCLVLPGSVSYISINQDYIPDGCTEKLNLYEYTTLEDLQFAIKRAIAQFQDESGFGCLILLYSAVFTRGLSKLQSDLEPEKSFSLISAAEEGSMAVVMLLLSGRATCFLHNGIIYVGDEDHYAVPHFGILSRSEVGFLLWDDAFENFADESRIPGSRLKTPSVPIWVISCNSHYGVLFNTNKELLRNYHAERRFELHHYTCGGTYNLLSVDTRFAEPDQNEPGTSNRNIREESISNCLEKLIHTKWQDAQITWLETSTAI